MEHTHHLHVSHGLGKPLEINHYWEKGTTEYGKGLGGDNELGDSTKSG
jgi:hypothetical protein